MSENSPKLQTIAFSTNLQLVLQQKGSKLRDRVMVGTHTGSRQASPVDYMKPIRAGRPQGRFAPMNRVDADFERRWVVPIDCEVGPQMFDNFDKLRMLEDPQSQAVTNAAYAVGRDMDDIIIQAAFADASITNVAGGTTLATETVNTTNFKVADTFGDGATSVGLTVEKLIEAKRIFRRYEVDLDMESPTLIIGSTQESDLLKLVQVVSTEYNDRPVLVDGKVTRFMGFDIIHSERLLYGSSIRKCIAFVKSGMYLGMWQDMQHDVSQRKDLSGLPWQVYTSYAIGATRLEPGRVLEIDCADTVTGPIVV
jgi:hypothetical protein